jgi:UDP-galactopyranose mutase
MAINKAGRRLYEQVFRGYTRKWWGQEPSELPITVTSRIKFRATQQETYQNDPFQGTPKQGFTAMFNNMLQHKNITIQLGTDYRAILGSASFNRMIYTGAIDDFFDNAHGRIPYRHMRYVPETLDQEYFQPCHQVNYPNDFAFMRTFEFKHATGQQHAKTTIIREYPMDAGPGMERHFPYPHLENNEIMHKYKRDAEQLKSVKFIGRLVDHKYYTMGQTVARALTRFRTEIAPWSPAEPVLSEA